MKRSVWPYILFYSGGVYWINGFLQGNKDLVIVSTAVIVSALFLDELSKIRMALESQNNSDKD